MNDTYVPVSVVLLGVICEQELIGVGMGRIMINRWKVISNRNNHTKKKGEQRDQVKSPC